MGRWLADDPLQFLWSCDISSPDDSHGIRLNQILNFVFKKMPSGLFVRLLWLLKKLSNALLFKRRIQNVTDDR